MAALLEVKGLKTQFFVRGGVVRAVDGIDFRVNRARRSASSASPGRGKCMTSLSIMRLVRKPGRIVAGSINFMGATCSSSTTTR